MRSFLMFHVKQIRDADTQSTHIATRAIPPDIFFSRKVNTAYAIVLIAAINTNIKMIKEIIKSALLLCGKSGMSGF